MRRETCRPLAVGSVVAVLLVEYSAHLELFFSVSPRHTQVYLRDLLDD